ncbi:MAG: hypothetical protein VX210_15300 [Myxococcota bacterium]|nr:hypothetical protein [Myxococcota bacterium]
MAKNVLLLNDPDNSLGEIQEAIQKAGYTAYMTDNSDDAIELFEKIEGKFCLLSLKAMGALDCLQIIQMFDDTVPIFFAGTGKETIKNEKAAKERGGNGFFKMPLKAPEILGAIKKNIGAGDPNAPLPDMPQAAPEAAPEPEPEVAEEPEAPQENTALDTASDELLDSLEAQEADAATEEPAAEEPAPQEAPAEEASPQAEAATTAPEPAAQPEAAEVERPKPAPGQKVHVVDIFADQEALAEQLAEIKAKEEAEAAAAAEAGEAAPPTPEAATPAPEAATPAPEAATPAPEAAAPAPEAATPAPEAAAPAPEAATPAPEAAAPAPQAAAPAPQAAAPAVPSPQLDAEREAAQLREHGLLERIQGLETELGAAKSAQATLTQELEALKSDNASKAGSLRQQQEEALAGLRQQQKEALERLGQQHQDALSSKDSELESTRQSLTELSSEAAELRSKLTGQSVELDSLKAQFEGEARRRQETEATVARLKEELNQGESLQAARGSELKSLEERLRERDQVIDELQRKFEEALRESREQQLSRENERSDEVNRFNELQGEVQALRESLADKERELLARERLEEQLEYDRRLQQRRVEEDVRRQTELNVRRQLEQERLYRRQKDRLEQFATSYFRPQDELPPARSAGVLASGQDRDFAWLRGEEVNAGNLPRVGLSRDIDGPNDIAKIFVELHKEGFSGRIDFSQGNIHKQVFLDKGELVGARSNADEDRYEGHLLRTGKITRARYQRLRLDNIDHPRLLAASLVESGDLRSNESFPSVREHLTEVFSSLFEWEKGSYDIGREMLGEDEIIRLSSRMPALVAEAVRRKYDLSRLTTILGPPGTLLGPSSDESTISIDTVELDSRERSVMRLFDSSRSLEDIIFSTGLGPNRVYQVAAILSLTGHIQTLMRDHRGFDLDLANGVDARRIEARLLDVRHQDYFSVLGLRSNATEYEVERAYRRALSEFSADNFSPSLSQSYREALSEIRRVLDDAYEVLRDNRLRERYAKAVGGPHAQMMS